MSRASIIRTDIYARDELEFKAYLAERGFVNVELFPSKKHNFLNIFFENPAEYMKYKLRGIEQEFMASRSHVYFYDFEDDFDVEDIFGDESN